MPAPLKLAPERVVRAREDYVAGKSIAEIIAENGFSLSTLYKLLAGKGAAAGMPVITLRSHLLRPRAQRAARVRASLVDRLWRAADRQVREIEKRLRLDTPPDERERDARVLATTVKTLRELRALDAAQAEQEPSPQDDNGPDNLDDFRRELARKMDAVIASRAAPGHGDAGC
jgi:hypothetical protein